MLIANLRLIQRKYGNILTLLNEYVNFITFYNTLKNS